MNEESERYIISFMQKHVRFIAKMKSEALWKPNDYLAYLYITENVMDVSDVNYESLIVRHLKLLCKYKKVICESMFPIGLNKERLIVQISYDCDMYVTLDLAEMENAKFVFTFTNTRKEERFSPWVVFREKPTNTLENYEKYCVPFIVHVWYLIEKQINL